MIAEKPDQQDSVPTSPDGRRLAGAARATEEEAIPRRAWIVLALVSFGLFIAYLDVTITNTAFPAIQATFVESSPSHLSWVINGYNVVFAALLIPAGKLVDRLGAKRSLFIAIGIFVTGSVACAAAPSADVLIAARVVQAIGAAGLLPSSFALGVAEFPPQRRVAATTAWAAAGALAAGSGPAVGSVIVEYGGWREAFLVNVVLLLTVPFAVRMLVERRVPMPAKPDLLGGSLLALCVGAMALAIVQSPTWGWTGTDTLVCWAVSATALVASVVHHRRTPVPFVDPDLLRVPGFAAAQAGAIVFCAAMFSLMLGNILFLTQIAGYSILEAGMAITPGPLATVVVAKRVGGIVERRGPRVVGVLGCLMIGGAAVGYMAAANDGRVDYVAEWLAPQILAGIAAGFAMAAFIGGALIGVAPERHNQAGAIGSSARQIGAVIGVSVLIAIAGDRTATVADFDTAWQVDMGIAALGAMTALLCTRIRRPRPASAPDPFPRRHVVLHGHRMAYRIGGDGPPLVLLHGLFDGSDTWRPLAKHLLADFTVIAPDLLGHGESAAPPRADVSPLGHAVHVRDLLDELGYDRVTIAGHSYGAGVAMAFAAAFRQRVDGMVLLAPAGLGARTPAVMTVLASPLGTALAWTLTRAPARGAVSLLVRVAPGLRPVRTILARMRERHARRLAFRTVRISTGPLRQRLNIVDRIPYLADVPALIVWGERDRMFPPSVGVDLHRRHTRSRLVLLDRAGHMAHRSRASEIAGHVKAFAADPPVPVVPDLPVVAAPEPAGPVPA